MAQLLPETEATEFEGRYYVNPQTTVDETNAFIDNYRNLQQTNNNQITNDTYNLGTAVPSSFGGLTGSGSYWRTRYQTPQTRSAIADLRTAAQSAALTTALENEKNVWTKRYNDAYRAYQQKTHSNSGSGGGSGGGGGGDGDGDGGGGDGDTKTTITTLESKSFADLYNYYIGQGYTTEDAKNQAIKDLKGTE